MSIISVIKRFTAPALPFAGREYDQNYFNQLLSVLRIYFNQLDNLLGQLVGDTSISGDVQFYGSALDAFGRVRASQPYTIFDSQNRYVKNNLFSESTASGGTVTYDANASTVELNITTTTNSEVVRQTYRSFSYQPGKSLLVMNTFVMPTAVVNHRIRVGYFNGLNGVFLERDGLDVYIVRRTFATGIVVDNRVAQSSWNGDKLDGNGASGFTLDLTKAQIFWQDFEWLGVGSVRCGFVINGQVIICHTFQNANNLSSVYMTTAILPIRYEIKNTGNPIAATLKQICSTVISEGGYEKKVAPVVVRDPVSPTAGVTVPVDTLTPLIAIQLAPGRTGAVVIPDGFSLLCTSTPADYEIVILKGSEASLYSVVPTAWFTTGSSNVIYSVDGTLNDPPNPASNIVHQQFASGSNQTGGAASADGTYNWNLQLGADLSGNSDVYVLAVRPISGNETFYPSLSFWDLT